MNYKIGNKDGLLGREWPDSDTRCDLTLLDCHVTQRQNDIHRETEGLSLNDISPRADANTGSTVEMYNATTIHVSECLCIKTKPLCFKKPKSPEREEILYVNTSENYKNSISKAKIKWQNSQINLSPFLSFCLYFCLFVYLIGVWFGGGGGVFFFLVWFGFFACIGAEILSKKHFSKWFQ